MSVFAPVLGWVYRRLPSTVDPIEQQLPEAQPEAPAPGEAPAAPPPRRRKVWRVLAALAALAVLGAGGAASLFWYWTRDLPSFGSLKDYKPLIITHVYGDGGQEVFQFFRERRTVVPFSDIPEVMRKAVLASEDAHFYEHHGVNYLATLRCAVRDLVRGRAACGASTITQQVVRTFLLTQQKKISRKVKEMVLATRLEQNLSKDEILWLYLNQIYFGHRRYGVEEASRFYFGKPVKDLTLGEAAVLAGVVQSPEKLSPVKHPHAAKRRQTYVLNRMAEEGFITRQQADAEIARPILVAPPPEEPPGDYYADAVRRYLNDKYGAERVETDGLQVDVAMDPAEQRAAEESLELALRGVDKRQGWRGPIEHLDAKQVQAALPPWRARLRATRPGPGELLVWDLARVSPDDIEPGEEGQKDLKRMLQARPLEEGGLYAGLVTAVADKTATVDLGNATGVIAYERLRWARPFKPTGWTPAPKRASDVLEAGDIALVRVLRARQGAIELARTGKPLALALEQIPQVQGALVSIDPVTRGVKTLVGGYDYDRSQFNRAFDAHRQPGSAFKPFVWGLAIDSQQYTPASIVYDTPVVIRNPWGQEWKPGNFEKDEFDGPMLLKAALAHSKNTVSAKLVQQFGPEAVIDFAQRCGVKSELPKVPALALGVGEVTPLELVNAYTTFDAGGVFAPPVLVWRVRDRDGNVLEERRADPSKGPLGAPEAVQAVRPETAFVLATMMKDVIAYGTGVAARSLERPAAGKTGTTQDQSDAWFVGFTPRVVAGAWVGFDSRQPMGSHETGAGAALPAWLAFMKAVTQDTPLDDFVAPANVEFARIDPRTGLLAPDDMQPVALPDGGVAAPDFVPFIAGTAPREVSPQADAPAATPQNFFQDAP